MKPRPIEIDGVIARIQLTKGLLAVIDAEDVPLVEGWNWTAMQSNRTAYAKRNALSGGAQKSILLHRVVLAATAGQHIDHIDGDGLNCRKQNLRFVSQQQNNLNTRAHRDNATGLKGVSKHTQCGKYRAEIQVGGVKKALGLFATPEQAHAAYCAASAIYHQQYGRSA